MRINNNISAINTNRVLGINNNNLSKDLEKLSSGLRINRAADDAAGMMIAEKLKTQWMGLNQASRNGWDGVSFIQTTEGYLNGMTDILQRVRQLSLQAANGVLKDEDRSQTQKEVDQLLQEIDRISEQAQFNRLYPLTGIFEEDQLVIHLGANADENIKINIPTMSTEKLGMVGVNLNSVESANQAIVASDAALDTVISTKATLGAFQARIETAIKSIDIGAENLQAAESRIRDVDMAKQMAEFTKDSILAQASTAMLSHANTQSQRILQLLQ